MRFFWNKDDPATAERQYRAGYTDAIINADYAAVTDDERLDGYAIGLGPVHTSAVHRE